MTEKRRRWPEQLHLYMSREQKSKLEAEAAKRENTVAALLRRLISDFLEKEIQE